LAGKLPQVGGARGAKMKNPPRQRGGGLKKLYLSARPTL
jgi:hypothetical protein